MMNRVWVCFFVLLCSSTIANAREIFFSLSTGIPNQKVFLVSDLMGWDSTAMRMNETGEGFYLLSLESPWLHELNYKFYVDGQWMLDPENQDIVPDGHGGYNSIVAFENFREDPLLFPREDVAPWKKRHFALTDASGQQRPITVVYPPAKWPGKDSVTVYFQDGGDYLARTGISHLLANLSYTPNMPLITGVFIPPRGDRIREYSFTEQSEKYMTFLTTKVVPAVEQQFPTGGSPSKRLLIGASMGGLISLQTALRHGNVFGLAASQSGSIWFQNEQIVSMIRNTPNKGLKFFIEVGIYEDNDQLDSNRKAYAATKEAGIKIQYREYPSVHDWIGWRNRLSEIFRYFFDSGLQSGRVYR